MIRSVARRCAQWLLSSLLVAGMLVVVPTVSASAADSLGACVAPGSGVQRLSPSAAFVLPDRLQKASGSLYELSDWVALFGELKQSGFESVVTQFTARVNTNDHTWEVFFPGSGIYTPATPDTTGPSSRSGTLERILAAAKQQGMKVTIGLGLDESAWFNDKTWQGKAEMDAEAARANRAIDAIWAQYSARYANVIDGWYLPYEFEGYNLDVSANAGLYKGAYVDRYLKPVSAHAVAVSGKTNISVSPLFTAARTASLDTTLRDRWTDFWKYVFNTTAVSIVAPQDGRGSGKNTLAAVKDWLAATTAAKTASTNPLAQVWGNAEAYRDQNTGVHVMPITMLAESLQAMRDGGATRMITFSASTFDAIPGHIGGSGSDRAAFAAAYREWVTTGACSSGGDVSAPGSPLAVTGKAVGENTTEGAIDTNVTLSWMPSTSSSTNAGRMPVAYQIRRDGRLIAEVTHNAAAPSTRLEFQDYQQQPGRTLVYTIQAYDGWGVLSPVSTQAVVTIPWTSAALESRSVPGKFNVARNAPFTVTNTESQPAVGAGGLAKPSNDSAVAAGDDSGKYGDEVGALAPKYTWGAGPATDGLLGTDNTYDGRWQAFVPSGTMHNWVMKFKVPSGAGVRQINTQWRHHPGDGVTLPDRVTVKARQTDGTTVTLGDTARADVLPTGATAPGTYWYTVTAAAELANVTEVWLEVTSQGAAQLFLGEVQINDNTSTNQARGQNYQFFPYGASADYSNWATGLRAWTLTDGTMAAGGSQDVAWAGRNMKTLGFTKLYITIDLGAMTPFEQINFATLHSPGESVGAPASWRTRTADGQGAWSAWASSVAITNPTAGRNILTRDQRTAARYVQLELTQRSTAEWIFLDEVEITATSTTDVAVGKPITLASNTPAALPSGAVPGCAQPQGSCNPVAANRDGTLSNLTSDAPYPVDWNNTENRWAITRFTDSLGPAPSLKGATYEIDLGDPKKIREITSTWIDDYNASLTVPAQITAYYLDTNGAWQPFGAVAKRPNTPQEIPQEMFTWTYRHVVTAPVTTRKIRISMQNGTLKPWGENETITLAGVARVTAHEVKAP